tara:strand:- start:2094 stop:2381 length:288 start_codon:yes stop_codon:yes gene_type:complete
LLFSTLYGLCFPYFQFATNSYFPLENNHIILSVAVATITDQVNLAILGVVQSQKEFAADHYCRAIEKYEEALADVPNDKTVLFNCAVTHFKVTVP